jgi:hypothetical protein
MAVKFDPILGKLRQSDESNALTPRGNWDADTNSPDITSEATVGDYWVVSVAGATDLGGITTWAVGDKAVIGVDGWLREPATAVTAYAASFVDADLIAGVLTVTHSLNDQYGLAVQVVDNSGYLRLAPVRYLTADALTVDLSAYGTLTGTWYVRVIKAGGSGTGSQAFTDLTDVPASYAGAGGKLVAVNAGADALEFVDAPSGGGGDFLVMQVFS